LDINRNHRDHDSRHDALKTSMASTVKPVMTALPTASKVDDSLSPSVFTFASYANKRLGALGFGPVHVSLWVEAKHVACPKLLLTLWTPSPLPGEVATLWSDMRIVL